MTAAAAYSFRIFVRTEETDLAVRAAEGLQALETGVSIVEHSGKCAEVKIKILGGCQRGPLSVLVVADDDCFSLPVLEREIRPIQFCHFLIVVLR